MKLSAIIATGTMVLLVTSLLGTACRKNEDDGEGKAAATQMAVGYLPVSTTLPNWIAVKDGIAERRGVAVEFKRYANSDLLLLALINGEIQATSVCADEPILAAASRGKLNAEIYLQEILTEDRVFDAIIVRADSPMQNIRDLAGKTVICFPGSQLKAYLRVILQKAGVDPDGVAIQQLPPPNILPALEARSADAAFTLEPFITIGSGKGLSRVLVPSPIAKYIGDGRPICAASFLISRGWADKNPKAADAFVRSVYDAVTVIEHDYGQWAARYPEFTPIPPELAEKVVITRFTTIQTPDLHGLRIQEGALRQAGRLEGPVDVERLIYRWRAQ